MHSVIKYIFSLRKQLNFLSNTLHIQAYFQKNVMNLRCKTFNQSFIFLDFKEFYFKDFHFNDTKIILKLILKKERIPFFNHISYIYEAILSK